MAQQETEEQEPSIEEILTSIRQIISEDDDVAEGEATPAEVVDEMPDPEPEVSVEPEPEDIAPEEMPQEEEAIELTDIVEEPQEAPAEEKASEEPPEPEAEPEPEPEPEPEVQVDLRDIDEPVAVMPEPEEEIAEDTAPSPEPRSTHSTSELIAEPTHGSASSTWCRSYRCARVRWRNVRH